jgi:dephospho-CoA kinase
VVLVWVTGSPGAGKSAVCDVLKGRGEPAVDADWEGYNVWVDRVSGEVADSPPYPTPQGWLDRYAWRINRARVEALAGQAEAGVAYLCGSVENEVEVWDLFDQVICLVIDDATLLHRLTTRTTNAFGKHPEELRAALEWNQTVEANYRRFGAAIIDASQPLEAVVSDIVAVVRRRSEKNDTPPLDSNTS